MAVKTQVNTDSVQTLTNKTLTAPVIATISNTGTITIPSSTDTLVGRATTDTLTNKTLLTPVLSGQMTGNGSLAPTITVPGTLKAGTDLIKNPVVFGTTTTQAHILGSEPVLYRIILQCLVADLGWSPGDRLVGFSGPGNYGGLSTGYWIWADSTNVNLGIGAGAINIGNKANWTMGSIIAGNWKMIITPYALV